MSNKRQLIAAIVLVSLFLLAASVLVVVLNHLSKDRMDSSEDVTERLRVTSSTQNYFTSMLTKIQRLLLEWGKMCASDKYSGSSMFCKSQYGGKRCENFFWYH